MNNDASTDMTETTETVGDILDQIAERLATFPNVVEEIRPAGGAGDVGVDVDAVYGLLPPSPSPSPAPAAVEEETDEESAPPVEEEEAKSEDQPDESESPVTPPRTIPVFTEPPAVLRRRRTLPEAENDSDTEPFVSLRTYSIENSAAYAASIDAAASRSVDLPTDMTDIQRQVCRAITPVLGEAIRTPSCFMSDTEGEEETEEEEADADDEAEAEAEAEEAEEDDIHPEEQLMVKMPFWIFGLTCAVMTLYLTFVIYLLSWECRFPMRGH